MFGLNDMYETLINANTQKFSDLTALDIVSSSPSILSCLIPGGFKQDNVLFAVCSSAVANPGVFIGKGRDSTEQLGMGGKRNCSHRNVPPERAFVLLTDQGHCSWLYCSSQLAMEGFVNVELTGGE